MKLFFRIMITCLICMAALLSKAAEGNDELRIVYNADVAPLKFEDESGQAQGLFPDIWRLWADHAGKKLRFIKVDSFNVTLDLLKTGQADLHAGLFKTPEREHYLAYSIPLLKLDYFLFSHPAVRSVHALEDTSGLIVGIAKGGFTEKFVRSRIPAERIAIYDGFDNLFQAAQTGEVKVFVSTSISLEYWLKQIGLANTFDYDVDKPLFTQVYHTAALKENSALIDTVDQGISTISLRDRKALEGKWIVQSRREIPPDFNRLLTDGERAYLSKKQVIKVHNENEWEPFNFNEAGVPKGFSIDYIKLIASKVGLAVEFVNGPTWNQFLDMMKSGDLDVMLNIARSKERETYLIFTPAYVKMIQMLYARNDFSTVHGIQDLFGKRFAIPTGFYLHDVLKDYPQIQVVEVKNTTEAIHAVSTGKADVLFDLMPVVNYILDHLQITNLKVGGDMGIVEGKPIPLHIAVSADQGVLAAILEKGMSRITDDEIRTLKERWLGSGSQELNSMGLTPGEQEWIANHPVIRVSNEMDYAPFDFFENNKPSGFSIDYLNLLAKRTGLRFNFIQKPWNEMLEMGKEKQIDLMHTIFKTPDRETFLLYSSPYKSLMKVIYVREGITDVFSIKDLAGKRLSVIKGDDLSEMLPDRVPDADYVYRSDYETVLKDLSLGRADATILDSAVANYLLRKLTITNVMASAEADIDGSDRYPTYRLAVRNDWPELLAILEKAMASVTPEEMVDLENHWFTIAAGSQDSNDKTLNLTFAERTWLGQNRGLKLGIDSDWPPFEFADGTGHHAGVTSDYVKILNKNLGLELTAMTGLSWKEMIEKARDGEIDVISSIMKTPERAEFLTFTKPHTQLPLVIITRADTPFIQGVEGLKGRTVAMVDGYAVVDFLGKDLPEQSFLLVPSTADAFRAVADGRADATVETIPTMTYYQKKLGLTDFKVSATTQYNYEFSFAVRKDLKQLASILDKAMAAITDQEKALILDKWANPQVTRQVDWTRVWQVALAVAAVAGFILFLAARSNRRLAAEVSERNAAELKIRAMSDASHDAIIMINSQGTVMFWNAAAERMFGYTAQESDGAVMHELFVPEEFRKSAAKGLRHFARTGQGPVIGTVVEHTALHRDGSRFPVEIAVSSFKLQDGWYAVGSIRDITERKTAEEELKTKERRFRTCFENSLVGMTITHPDKGWIEISGRFQEMMGYSRQELEDLSWENLSHPEDLKADREHSRRMLAGDISSYSMDKRFVRKDGSILYTNLVVSCVRNTQGAVEMVLAFYLDITDRKKAEAEIKHSQQRLAQIIDSLPDPTFVIDKAGVVTAWNRAMTEMTGVSAQEMMGKGNFEYALPFYGERRPLLINLVQEWDESLNEKYLSISEKDDGVLVSESFHPDLNSGTYLSGTARVLFDINGNPTGAIESVRDVTETRRIQEALQESEARVKMILDSVSTGIILIDPEGRTIADVNPVAAEMIGLSSHEIIGKKCHQFICQREDLECPILDYNQDITNAEGVLLTAEGQTIPILKTVVPIILGGKRYFLESIVDIRQRIAAEEELKRNLEELERFNKLTINREERMIQLKAEINKLHESLGKKPKYKIFE